MGFVQATEGGVWKVLAHSTTDVFDPTVAGALAASTRYWVYASIVAGVVTYTRVIDTFHPDAGLHYKTGPATDYLYVTTFVTNAAGDILKYTQSDNIYRYGPLTTNGGGVDGNLVLDGGTQTTAHTVSFGYSLPSAASEALLYAGVTGTDTPNRLYLGQVGTAAGDPYSTIESSGVGAQSIQPVPFALTGALQFEYFVAHNTSSALVWVGGFTL